MEALAHKIELKDNAFDTFWSNSDNKEFYEHLSFEEYQRYLALAGLSNNPDLEQIKDYILSASSILDVGPGYGRIIEGVRKLGYKGEYAGVEFSHRLVEYLKESYRHDEIVEKSFLNYSVNKKFDLVLMMWSTISVFNPENEQQACFYQCAKMLNDNGHCIIDLLISNSAKNAINTKFSQFHVTHAGNNTTHYAYSPGILELIRYVARAGLAVREIKEYKAATAERCLVILGKS